MSESVYIKSAVAAGVIGTAAAYLAYRYYQKENQLKLPTEWRQVGTLQDLYVYPIKSCGPVLLKNAECSSLGLRDGFLRDRVLMIVDEDNVFIHARTYPHLLLIKPSVKNSILTLRYSDMEPIDINLAEVSTQKNSIKALVWDRSVPAYECGPEASKWITSVVGRPDATYRLVLYASDAGRGVRPKQVNKYYTITCDDTGAMPDELAYNLINLASVDDLNSRLKDCTASPRNFRPNFVLKGAKPYEEDNWKFVKIGENIFEVIKPCTRCILVNIDPETGERNSNFEPLQTLKEYRMIEDPEIRKAMGDSPCMGIQLGLRSGPGGKVSLHDPICVA